MSRGRALRTGVAFDMRTGMKTRGRKLQPDGERPGIWVERSWADRKHPQRYVRVPPPDGLTYRPGPPAQHKIGARVDLSWVMVSDTNCGTDGGTTQQAFGVLRRQDTPRMHAGINYNSFFVGEVPSPDIEEWHPIWVVSLIL